ncbi:TetR/AcrR family transcriptional regulator [Rubritalea spongiae]|uniref:TetR/AcrR family transcriptional regulator n=1 Tax=Rubritalea spongiae TaxID=430797 RepID=A0ABW5E3W6_9BACT
MNLDSENEHPVRKPSDRRQRKREEKRLSIMAAAERVFHAGDVTNTSMEEIAREADVAAGTLYNYFSGKEALFMAVFERKLSEVFSDATAQWTSDTPFKDRLGKIIRLHLGFIHDHKGFYEYLLSLGQPDYTQPGTFSVIIDLCESHLERQTAAFKAAQDKGEISEALPPQFLSRAMRSLCWGMASDAVNRRKTHDLNTQVEPILQLFWKGITP